MVNELQTKRSPDPLPGSRAQAGILSRQRFFDRINRAFTVFHFGLKTRDFCNRINRGEIGAR